MLHGKSTQTLSVRELEAELKAREDAPYGTRSSEPDSSVSPETPLQMRQRVEREERVRLQVRSRLEGLAQSSPRPTLPFGVRLVYFFVVGYWFGCVWLALSLVLCLSIIGFRPGVAMLRRTGEAFTLW